MKTILPRGVIDGRTPVTYKTSGKHGVVITHEFFILTQMDPDIERIRKRIKELTPSSGWSKPESGPEQDLETLRRRLIHLEARIGRREVEEWARKREAAVERRGGDEGERRQSAPTDGL